MPNGLGVDISAPPADVPPTTPGYGTRIGCIELAASPQAVIPANLLVAGGATFPAAYRFKEYRLIFDGNQVQELDISGETIDWAASELNQSGTLTLEFGISRFYALVGVEYRGDQYTYLRCEVAFLEDGISKSNSYVVRMKHF